jgi:hypothetical protein
MDGWKSTAIAPYNTHQNRTDTDRRFWQTIKEGHQGLQQKLSFLASIVGTVQNSIIKYTGNENHMHHM